MDGNTESVNRTALPIELEMSQNVKYVVHSYLREIESKRTRYHVRDDKTKIVYPNL
jgi:hypothetical protein